MPFTKITPHVYTTHTPRTSVAFPSITRCMMYGSQINLHAASWPPRTFAALLRPAADDNFSRNNTTATVSLSSTYEQRTGGKPKPKPTARTWYSTPKSTPAAGNIRDHPLPATPATPPLSPPLPYLELYACARATSNHLLYRFGLILPICQPQDRRTLTTLGVTAAVMGTRTKMKVLWIAYARASCVARPGAWEIKGQ